MSHRQSGFTLIELMIVVVVLGLLAALAIPNYQGMANRARVAEVKQNMFVFQLTVEDFSTRNNGEYPANAAATTAEFPSSTMPSLGLGANRDPNTPTITRVITMGRMMA